ncbi:MAG: PKD domain-containing protein [bacterium]|nr:PKD domain-containing protein [bacterium]
MRKKLLLIFSLSIIVNQSIGQTTSGKDFWVAFLDAQLYCATRTPPPPPPLPPGPFEEDTLELYITSQYAAKIKVVSDNKDDINSTATYTLTPNVTLYIQVHPHMCNRNLFSDNVNNRSVHITADTFINVQAVNRFWSSKGATTVIPSESIPFATEYFITTNESPNQWVCNKIDFGGKINKSAEFVVVGISDTSVIEVIPSGVSSVNDNKRGIPYNVTLKKGETYHYVTTDDDLTGSIIRARTLTSKFGVFAGNRQTYSNINDSVNLPCNSAFPFSVYTHNPLDDLAFLDHTYEQMFPTTTMGNSYILLPFKNNFGGYYFKTLAIENNTKVFIGNNYYKTLNQGEYFTYNVGVDSVMRVSANKRISVTQFSKGNKCNKHSKPKTTMGDISQVQVVPDLQWITDANVGKVTNVPFNSWVNSSSNFVPENYVNIIVKTADTSKFKVNGASIVNYLWRPSLMLNGYKFVQLNIDKGNYHLVCPNGFMAYTYGYGNFEGYALLAGASFKNLHNNFVVSNQCKQDTLQFTRVVNDSFKSYVWDFGDKSTRIAGASVAKIFKDTGFYNVTMYSKHIKTGILDSVIKRLYIGMADTKPVLINDTAVCGHLELLVLSQNRKNFNSYLWEDKSTLYYRLFKQPGQYWEKVTERNGCIYFDTLNILNYPSPVAKFTSTDTVFCSNGTRDIFFQNLSTSKDTLAIVNWDFGDLNVNDTHEIVKHLYKKPDLYQVSLRLTTNHGCQDVATQLIEIKSSPKPEFTYLVADTCFNSNSISFKNNTQIDSLLFQKYKWEYGDGTSLTNRTFKTPHVYPDSGVYEVKLLYEYNNGCNDTARKLVTIVPNPKSNFTFVSGGQCLSDPFVFTNKSTATKQPLKSLWLFGDTQSDTNKNVQHRYYTQGVYTVQLIVESVFGCKDTASQTVKTLSGPEAKFTLSDSILCKVGNRFKFSNTSISDTGKIVSTLWRFADGSKILNKDTVTKSFANAGKNSIVLKVTNNFGCSDTLLQFVETKPGPSTKFSINDNTQCDNLQSFDFSYLSQKSNDSIKGYSWYFNNDSVKNIPNITNFKFPKDGVYTVSLRLNSLYDCDGEMIQTVFVNPQPVAAFSVQSPIECFFGHAFKFANLSTISSGKLAIHQWDFGDGTNASLFTPVPKTYANVGNYKVSYKVVSDSGCMDTVSKFIQLLPSATINSATSKGACLSDSILFQASVSLNIGNIKSYVWDFGDGQTGNSSNIKHLYQNQGSYTVIFKAITDNNCQDSVLNTIKIVKNPKADFVFVHFNKDNSGIRFLFLDRSENANSWNWKFDKWGTSSIQEP